MNCSIFQKFYLCELVKLLSLNPLSANSDQNHFSPNDIDTLSRDYVTRIDKMITKGKML